MRRKKRLSIGVRALESPPCWVVVFKPLFWMCVLDSFPVEQSECVGLLWRLFWSDDQASKDDHAAAGPKPGLSTGGGSVTMMR